MNEARELYCGVIRLRVLHQADHEPFFSLWMAVELSHHGRHLSPGTLDPVVAATEREVLLRSSRHHANGKIRRLCRPTAAGRAALRSAKKLVQERAGEMFEGER